MDLELARKGFGYARKRKKWMFVMAALGFSGYGAYRVYHLPSVSRKRKRLLKLLGALVSVVEVLSDIAESIGVVSRDLKEFLQSDCDEIPNSLKQVSKICRSDEFSGSVVKVTQAVTLGVLRGYQAQAKSQRLEDGGISSNTTFMDQVVDKLFTKAGSGFVSVVVGSFAKNLVLGFFSDEQSGAGSKSATFPDQYGMKMNDVPRWVEVACSEKCRDLIADCIQLFVSTAVAVYLDKTTDINTYDDIFSGLTNPKHEAKVKDMIVSVCNGAVETLVRSSNQVLTSSKSNVNHPNLSSNSYLAIEDGGWISQVSSTLAVPSNRSFVLDLTGRVTSETVRSSLDFLLDRLFDGMRRRVNSARVETVDKGVEVVKYAVAKSSVIATICLSLCLHVIDSPWLLAPG
ncbi:protein PHLOEM PROTEIN 2-LIKE A10 [Argentina anserina]|uniref:protein PHLOEM PROTEIN 2-LIKE A10 n=1 Tax=Argentina anserina TaxID=57926 RepID=UPI0021765137|nr:protein PHLOEM PROTEIN 2-LIKE A10 [Potentilla anserina]